MDFAQTGSTEFSLSGLHEPETPSKCFFEARGDVASPN